MDSEMHDERLNMTKPVDVIRKYHDQDILSVFILENQSTIDSSMVIRSAYYEFLTYDRMLKHAKKNKQYNKDTKFPMCMYLYSIQVKGMGAVRKIAQGRLQGLEQGIEQGEQETKKDMYKKMLDKGFTVEQIANIFVVSIESIENLIEAK